MSINVYHITTCQNLIWTWGYHPIIIVQQMSIAMENAAPIFDVSHWLKEAGHSQVNVPIKWHRIHGAFHIFLGFPNS